MALLESRVSKVFLCPTYYVGLLSGSLDFNTPSYTEREPKHNSFLYISWSDANSRSGIFSSYLGIYSSVTTLKYIEEATIYHPFQGTQVSTTRSVSSTT